MVEAGWAEDRGLGAGACGVYRAFLALVGSESSTTVLVHQLVVFGLVGGLVVVEGGGLWVVGLIRPVHLQVVFVVSVPAR